MTWNYPVTFTAAGALVISKGNITRQYPVITSDITSISASNLRSISIQGSNDGLIPVDLNAVFPVNTSSALVFGSVTTPVEFSFSRVAANREITVYIGGTSSSMGDFNTATIVYDKLNIIQCSGFSAGSVTLYSPYTWNHTFSIPLTQVSATYVLSGSNFPLSYGFGRQSNSIFQPTINVISNATNIGAILE
jgi:hypothetical protein